MNIKIVNKIPQTIQRLPEVGEIWKHSNDSEIYMRVDDSAEKAFNFVTDDSFFSVDLSNGQLRHTKKNSDTIVILKQEEVLNVHLVTK